MSVPSALVEWLELRLVLVLLLLALVWPHLGGRWFAAVERFADPVLRRPRTQLIAIAFLAIVLRGIFLPWIGPPEPFLHDEYGILLQAQTFVSGRLTNPTHPLWVHFEAPHISHQPTYSSAFFPGRSLHVALGYLLGHPWAGVWISVVAMCVAICWMLQAIVPLPYAFIGGALAVLRFGVFSYWINSYWGGAVTALGGALALGALARIMRRMSVNNGIALGAGVFLLIISRPYEGLLFCIPLAAWLVVWLWKQRPDPGRFFRLVVAPASALSVSGVGFLMLHSWSVTGDPTLTPYSAHRRMYATAPAFIILPLSKPPEYRHDRMRRFYEWETGPHQAKKSKRSMALRAGNHVLRIWAMYVGPALTIPFLVAITLVRTPIVRFLVAAGLLFFGGYFLETWTGNVHYASPITALAFALIAIGLQRLRSIQWLGRPFGLLLSRTLPLACMAVLLVPAVVVLGRLPASQSSRTLQMYLSWCCMLADTTERSRMLNELLRVPEQDLVLVRYATDYSLFDDWVYNDADIDRSPVVWALDLGPERNRRLLEYFKNRRIWLVDLSPTVPPRLAPYQDSVAN